jgi:Sec-independent protein translocase protein TatA
VGYFVLGPSDLYKLTKEIGKFIQNIQTLGSDLSTTLETNMESQLQLEDLRKAQRELTDAFSFRRSINVDDAEEAFATNVATPRVGKSIGDVEEVASEVAAAGAGVAAAAGSGAAAAPPKKKKKYRRRKVVKEEPMEEEESNDDIPDYSGDIPDLDMNSAFPDLPADPVTAEAPSSDSSSSSSSELTPEEEAVIEQEFGKYTMTDPNPMSEWYDNTMATSAKDFDDSATAATEDTPASSEESTAEAQSRFQQQLSGTWNDNVLANQDKLSPLASVMELLAVLEQEKNEADKQMEEEFRQRAELKEIYYKKQRSVLEKAATQIQQDAYVGADEAK